MKTTKKREMGLPPYHQQITGAEEGEKP